VDANGGTLVVGDKIEARYKGKGSKRYPGTISAVALGVGGSPTTFSILYDDNDSESGAKCENIWRIGPSKGDSPVEAPPATPAVPAAAAAAPPVVTDAAAAQAADAQGNALAEGDRVECRYKGKGSKYYPGKISQVVAPITAGMPFLFSIAYDDGDSESGALGANIRRVGASKADKGEETVVVAVQKPAETDPQPPATSLAALGSAASAAAAETVPTPAPELTAAVAPAPSSSLTSSSSSAAAAAAAAAAPVADLGPKGADKDGNVLVAGDSVEALFKGKGKKYYPGVIAAVTPGQLGEAATYSIKYNDGDSETGALSSSIRRLGPSKAEAGTVPPAPAAAPEAPPAAAAPSAAVSSSSTASSTAPAAAPFVTAEAPAAPAPSAQGGASLPAAPNLNDPKPPSAGDSLGLRGKDMDGKVRFSSSLSLTSLFLFLTLRCLPSPPWLVHFYAYLLTFLFFLFAIQVLVIGDQVEAIFKVCSACLYPTCTHSVSLAPFSVSTQPPLTHNANTTPPRNQYRARARSFTPAASVQCCLP
jgi:hypothetical protein